MTIRNLYLRVGVVSLRSAPKNRQMIIEHADGSITEAIGCTHIEDLYMKPFIKLKLKRII